MTGLGKKRSVFQNWVDEFLQLGLMSRVVVFVWVIEISSWIHLEWLQKAKGSIHTHTDNRITIVGKKVFKKSVGYGRAANIQLFCGIYYLDRNMARIHG